MVMVIIEKLAIYGIRPHVLKGMLISSINVIVEKQLFLAVVLMDNLVNESCSVYML